VIFVCNNFLATARDKRRCHICRQPEAAHITGAEPMKSVDVPFLDIDNVLYHDQGRNIPPRGRLERRIVANLIDHLQRAGWSIFNVFDSEEDIAVGSMKEAMELVFNLDESWLDFRNAAGAEHRVFIVLGNGVDCIADYNYSEGGKDNFDEAMKAFDPDQFA
jgi:hypothetical protein